MKNLIFLILFFSFPMAHAVQELELGRIWPLDILAHYKKMTSGELTNAQGLKLAYRYVLKPGNTKILVILPGQSEPVMKYAELLYDLRNSGHDLFILDHQGQGASGRLLKDSQKGHVRYFQDYVDDLFQFMQEVVLPKSQGKKLHLLAHSMGAAISVEYMGQNPQVFDKAILSAPMLQIVTDPFPEKLARAFAKFLVKVGKGANYAPTRGPYDPHKDQFKTNPFTNSEARHGITKHINVNYPELVVGGPTARWVHQSLYVTRFIEQRAEQVTIPFLLFQAGQDLIVRTQIQKRFCEKASQCELVTFPESKHEILMEKDADRDRALARALEFFSGP